MSTKRAISVLIFAGLLATPAVAACPAPTATENTAEHLAQQRARLVCLQNELARTSEDRTRDFEIDAINRDLDHLQLQRKFDALDFTPPEF